MQSKEFSLLQGGSDIDTVGILTLSEGGDDGNIGSGGGNGSNNALIPNYNYTDYDAHHGLDPEVYVPTDDIHGSMARHASKPGRFDRFTVLYAIPDFPQTQLDNFFQEEDMRQRAFIESNWQVEETNNIDLERSDRETLEKIPEYHRGFSKYADAFRIDKTVGRETSWLRHGNPYGYDSSNRVLYATSHQYPFTYTVSDGTLSKELPFYPPFEEHNPHVSCVLFPVTARFQVTEVTRWNSPAYWMDGLVNWDLFKVDEHWMTYQRLRPFPVHYLDSITNDPSEIDYWHQFNLMSSLPVEIQTDPIEIINSINSIKTVADTIESRNAVESLDLAPAVSPDLVPALGSITAAHRVTIASFSQEIVTEIDYVTYITKNRSFLFLINAEKTRNFNPCQVTMRISGLPKDFEVKIIKGAITFKNVSDSVVDVTVNYNPDELVSFAISKVNAFQTITIENVKTATPVNRPMHFKIYNTKGFDTIPFVDKASTSANKLTIRKI